MKKQILTALLIAAMSPAATFAQDVQTNPAVTHLMQSYGLAKADAQMRIDLQTELLALSERLNTENDAAYADMYIQHEPTYKIVILFADKKDRKAFLESVDPKLRRYVQLKAAKKSRGVAARELEEINAALSKLTVPFTSEYDLQAEKFIVRVESQEAADQAAALLPDTRKVETTIEVGPVPKAQAAPTGVVAGDRLYGGDPVYQSPGSGVYCTLGYAVNYTDGGVAKKGILTAGHCYDPMSAYVNGHYVTLSGPVIDKPHKYSANVPGYDGISDKYDYQIWETTGLTVDNSIRYTDKNNIPEFPDSGTLRMTSITTFMNQKAGMIVCKSGNNTGITCGEITNGNKTHDGVAGWIEVSKTKQSVISLGGDSGGPWFLYPGTSTTIVGVGIHTAGDSVPGTAGIAIYMPIDYIDDHISSVSTIKQ